jgi:hypothetical protein
MRAWAELSFMAVPKSKPGQFPDCEDKPRRSPKCWLEPFFCATWPKRIGRSGQT